MTDSISARFEAYPVAMQNALMSLESLLRDIEESKDIIMGVLAAAGRFYEADRAYIMEADRDLRIGVNTYEWCADGVTKEIGNLQYIPFERVPCWEKALRNNQPLIIRDVNDLKDDFPDEYFDLTRQGISALLATPYSKRINTGFVAVDNPRKYADDPSFLLLLSYVIVVELNEIKMQRSLSMAARRVTEQSPNIIHINLFGGLEIISAKGILRDDDFSSDQGCNLLTYLLFTRGSNQPVYRLCEINRLDSDVDDPYSAVKSVVYRLRNTLSLIGLQDLIQATRGTFILNPKYTIHTDVDRFDEICLRISQANKPDTLENLYKRMTEIYKGSLVPWYDYFPWLIPKASYYQNRYLDSLKHYIELLNEKKDYLEVQRIATKALAVSMHDGDFLFYSIKADLDMGKRSLAKTHYKQAENYLTEEQKTEILERL